MKQNSKELEKIYANSAFGKCITLILNSQNGQNKPIDYRMARVGVGNGLWVDNEGVLHVQGHGRFMPYSLIAPLFDKLGKEDFSDGHIKIKDAKNPGGREVRVRKFGKRNLVIGEDGVLYNISQREDSSYSILPLGLSNEDGRNSQLYYRAYETAQKGYDAALLQTARKHIEKSDLPDEGKRDFNSKLDRIVESFEQEVIEGGQR